MIGEQQAGCARTCAARPRRRRLSWVLISIAASAAISARLFRPSSSAQAASAFRASTMRRSGVEARSDEAGSIRAPPFPRPAWSGTTGRGRGAVLGAACAIDGKGEASAQDDLVSLRLDLMQPRWLLKGEGLSCPETSLIRAPCQGQGEGPGVDAGPGPHARREKSRRAGRGRARCGGMARDTGTARGADLPRAWLLNQDPRPCPVCLPGASRLERGTCAAWNVATHATDLNSRSCFVHRGIGLESGRHGLSRSLATTNPCRPFVTRPAPSAGRH